MIRIGFHFALREPVRFSLTVCGLACAVVLTVFLAGVYQGVVRGSLSYIADSEADVWVGRPGSWNLMRSSGLLSGSVGERLRGVRGVESVEPILAALLPAEVGQLRRTLLVVGLEDSARLARPRRVLEGLAVPRTGELVIDRAFATRAGIGLGDTIELAGHPLRIAGITDDTNLLVTQYAFVARRDLLSAVGLADGATFFLVRTEPMVGTEPATVLEERVAGIAAYDRATFLANNREELESGFLPVLWAVAVLGLIVGVSVVSIVTYTAVLDRREDYVLLAAIGAGRSVRFVIVMQQALLAAAVGGFAGLALLAALQRSLPTFVPELSLRVEPWIGAAAFAGALVMAAIGAVFPGRVATQLTPLEALRR
jgi:putative ABC transport system permease protein